MHSVSKSYTDKPSANAAESRRGRLGNSSAAGERRYELDWLRTLVVLGIVPYHALVIFGASTAIYIKGTQPSPLLALVGSFILTWGIPLIFLMAGAGTRFALQVRSPAAYIRERVGRLVMPLLLVALVFSPIQDYFILLSNPSLVSVSPVPIQHPEQLRSITAFYQVYLTTLVTTVRQYSPAIGTLVFTHLWFVPRLLIVSLLILPLFVYLQRRGQSWVSPICRILANPLGLLFGGALVPAALVALVQPAGVSAFTAHWIFTDVWPEFVLDLCFFVAGFLIYASPSLQVTVRRCAIPALVLGVAYWLITVAVSTQGAAQTHTLSPTAMLFALTQTLSAWLLALALLGLAMRLFSFTSPLQRYLTPAAFPVYVLHMPLLTVIAYYMLKVTLPWPLQLLLITLATAGAAFGVYEGFIRRTRPTRLLFGIKEPHMKSLLKSLPPSGHSAGSAQTTASNANVLQPPPAHQPANLAQLFRDRSTRFAEHIRWRQREGDAWRTTTYREQQTLVNQLMCGLDALGARQGDFIGIFSQTRWEWLVSDWAITGLGAITTTLYPTLTAETAAFILRDAGVRYLFVEDAAQYDKIRLIRDSLPDLRRLILFDAPPGGEANANTAPSNAQAKNPLDDPMVLPFSALLTLSPRTPQEADAFAAERALEIESADPAALIYTSGTTGQPKGVIHTHRMLLAQLAGVRSKLTTVRPGMVDLLFLPLAHALARLEHLLALDLGCTTVIEPHLPTVMHTILEARPHMLLAVPRVYEKAYATLVERAASSPRWQQTLFAWAQRVGSAAALRRESRQSIPLSLHILLALAEWLVFRRVRAAFGGRLQFAVSGGAPLDPAIARYFHALGIPLLEGWGLTETGGGYTINALEDFRIRSVGKPYTGEELRIAADGEILVRGPCVFSRYHNNPQATAEALDVEGWFHTGDIGTLDAEGFLTIVDRKKELIVTAGGKKIPPQRVEILLTAFPLVAHAYVYGDRKPYLVALLTLDPAAVTTWARTHGLTADAGQSMHDLLTTPHVRSQLRAELDEHLQHVNAQLARFEQIKRYDVLADDFTVDNGLLTPTLKPRRKEIAARYQNELAALYTLDTPVSA